MRYFEVFISVIKKIHFEIRCFLVDHSPLRILGCTTCFEIFPPSMYLRHTEEEMAKLKEEASIILLDYLEMICSDDQEKIRRHIKRQ